MTWCIDCGEEFHDDDTGGYNPPCVCGAHCRDCHDAEQRQGKYMDDDERYCPFCGRDDCDCGAPEGSTVIGERETSDG